LLEQLRRGEIEMLRPEQVETIAAVLTPEEREEIEIFMALLLEHYERELGPAGPAFVYPDGESRCIFHFDPFFTPIVCLCADISCRREVLEPVRGPDNVLSI
jgi:hypothetical protein